MAAASFVASTRDPPYAALIVAELAGIPVTEGDATSVTLGNSKFQVLFLIPKCMCSENAYYATR